MRTLKYISLALLLGMAACHSDGLKPATPGADTMQGKKPSVAGTAKAPVRPDDTSYDLFEYRNDTLIQRLKVWRLSKGEIRFDLSCTNRASNRTSTLAGTAKSKPGQDPETDEDEEGLSYAAIEYVYHEGACEVMVRIDMEEKNKARIVDDDCQIFYNKDAPLSSVGVLRKVKK